MFGAETMLKSLFSFHLFFLILGYCTLVDRQLDHFADDPGVGWHLATGKYILEQREIPRTDPFLASSLERSWVADQWLSDLLLYVWYSLGSWDLVYTVFVSIYFLSYFLLFYHFLRSFSSGAFAALLGMVMCWKVSQLHFILRPSFFGFLFFMLCLKFSYDILRGSHWKLLVFPVLVCFCLWANMHPSFVLGLLLLGLLVFSLALDEGFKGKRLRSSLVVFLIASLATLLNPYFTDLHRSIFELSQSRFFMEYHAEWQAPSLQDVTGILAFLAFTFVVLVPLLTRKVPGSWNSFTCLSIACFAYLALDAVRMLPYFSIVLAVPLVQLSSWLAEQYAKEGGAFAMLIRNASRLGQWEASRKRAVVSVPALIVIICVSFVWKERLLGFLHEAGPSKAAYPFNALPILKAQDRNGEPIRVLAPARLGGFLTFFGDGDLQALADDRNTLLGEAFYRRFHRIQEDANEMKEFLEEYSVDIVLWPAQGLVPELLSSLPLERLEFGDDLYAIWKKQSQDHPKIGIELEVVGGEPS